MHDCQAEWNQELLMAGVRSAWKEALGHALTCCPDTDTLYHLLPDKPHANGEDSVQSRFFCEVRSRFFP